MSLNDEAWRFLENHSVNVGFSIDGYKELHDKNRGNSFDNAMHNVEEYKRVTGHYPTFNATVGEDSLLNTDKVINFFKPFGVRVTFSRMIGYEVYIYVGQSVGAILYKCNVINVDMNTCSDNDMEYNINGQLSTVGRYMRLKLVQSFEDGKFPRKALLENGLKTVQGPTKATEQLIAYLEQ